MWTCSWNVFLLLLCQKITLRKSDRHRITLLSLLMQKENQGPASQILPGKYWYLLQRQLHDQNIWAPLHIQILCFYWSTSIQKEFFMCLFFVLSQVSTIFHYKMVSTTILKRPHMPDNTTSRQCTLQPPGLPNDYGENSPGRPSLHV